MNKKFCKIVAVILASSLLAGSSAVFATETRLTTEQLAAEMVSEYTLENLPDNLKAIAGKEAPPVAIDPVNSEDMYAFTAENSNGSKTLYSFAEPIKFKDSNGKIKFKDDTLVQSAQNRGLFSKYAYENKENDIKYYLPSKISQGVMVKYKQYQMEFTPVLETDAAVQKVYSQPAQKDMVCYNGVFGQNSTLEYLPLNNGLKENIVLESYNGRNEFSFTVKLKNLSPAFTQAQSIPLLDKETGQRVMYIGQVDVKDSYNGEDTQGRPHFSYENIMRLLPGEKQDEYTLTITVDKVFLEDENTQYPVIIDPMAKAWQENLSDTTIRHANPNTQNYYTDSILQVGNVQAREARALAKINNIMHLSYIEPDNITNASYNVYEHTNNTSSYIVQLYDLGSSWSDNTVTWNNQPATSGWQSENVVNHYGWYAFDITNLMRRWVRYGKGDTDGKSAECGIMLKGYDALSSFRNFGSKEGGDTYFQIGYEEPGNLDEGYYYIKNKGSGKYLDVQDWGTANNSNVQQWSYAEGANQLWYVKKVGTYYTLQPQHTTGKYLTVYNGGSANSQNVVIGSSDTISARWKIIKNTYGDLTYRILSNCSNCSRALVVENASTANGANVFQYQYSILGGRNDDWIFESANFYGAAYTYDELKTSRTDINCAGFALKIDEFLSGDMLDVNNWDSVDTVAQKLKTYLNTNYPNRSIRIAGKNLDSHFYINKNEYRIAMRVITYKTGMDDNQYDYHFYVQTSNGQWAHKPGGGASAVLGYINPTTYNWPNGYNSNTVYLAVSR